MPASSSYLSDTNYSYGLVVAVTQASLNATMREYLSKQNNKEVVVCYVADDTGKPIAKDFEEVKKALNNKSPFDIPDGADPKSADVQLLYNLRFMYALVCLTLTWLIH